MAGLQITLPQMTEEDISDREERKRLRSYLYQLTEQLRYTLGHIDDENVTAGGLSASRIGNFNQEAASVARAEIGQARIGTAQVQHLEALVAKLAQAAITSAEIDWAQIRNAIISMADIRVGDIDNAIVADMVGGKVHIRNLAIDEANAVSLTAGQLMVRGEDGSLYRLAANEDGSVAAMPMQVTGDALADGSINAGEKLVEGSITVDRLNAADVFGSRALLNELTAGDALVNRLKANQAFVDTLTAMGKHLDLSANESITAMVGQVEGLRKHLCFDAEGLHLRGESDGLRELQLTPEALILRGESGAVAAAVTADTLDIENARLQSGMTVGHYQWRAMQDGSIGLLYEGGNQA